jgi:hypothetical protein
MRVLSIAIIILLPLHIFSQKTEYVTDPLVQPVIAMEQDTAVEIITAKGTGILKDTLADVPFIAFERNIIDAGHIEYGDKVTCIYRFVNRSFENIKIDYIQSSSAILATYPKNVIEPGAMGYMCVTFFTGLTANQIEFDQLMLIGFKSKDNKKSYLETLSLTGQIEKPEKAINQTDLLTTSTSY